MTAFDLDGLERRHFPRVSTLDRSRHLATCEYGYWRDGKRPVPCSKHCQADRALLALLRLHAAGRLEDGVPVQMELLKEAS